LVARRSRKATGSGEVANSVRGDVIVAQTPERGVDLHASQTETAWQRGAVLAETCSRADGIRAVEGRNAVGGGGAGISGAIDVLALVGDAGDFSLDRGVALGVRGAVGAHVVGGAFSIDAEESDGAAASVGDVACWIFGPVAGAVVSFVGALKEARAGCVGRGECIDFGDMVDELARGEGGAGADAPKKDDSKNES